MISKQKTILIVDDEALIRGFLNQTLSSQNYRCEEAGSSEQALEKLTNRAFDLVILDINMPGKSGIELLSELKSAYPETAVVMATAVLDINVAIQCMKNGAYDYIQKPFDLEIVVMIVNRALEKSRLELEIRDHRQNLELKVSEQAKKIRESFLSSVTALANALEAKDRYTYGHSQRVSRISVAIAQKLGLEQQTIDTIRLAALVHDIGKIGVSETILNKPSPLTEDEYTQIQQHPVIGEHIVYPIIVDTEIIEIVRGHHERYDGTGYPDELKGSHIPLGARIIAVADAYEAMTSERPYRSAMLTEIACAELDFWKGIQFDPGIVDAFLGIENGLFSYPMAQISELSNEVN